MEFVPGVGSTDASAVLYGPPMPTAAERQQGLHPSEEDLLASLKRHYVPTEDTVSWIRGHIAAKSSAGPRHTAVRFWHMRPSEREACFHVVSPSEFSMIFETRPIAGTGVCTEPNL